VCINFCGGRADRQTVGGDVNILYSINIDLTLEQANFLKKFGITDYKHKVRQVLLLKDTMIKMCVLCFVSDFI
jgi:hypothetical protein